MHASRVAASDVATDRLLMLSCKLILFGERHLRRTLSEFAYHAQRPDTLALPFSLLTTGDL